ncbi:phage tail tube protein [Jiella avicenniae]|uniref:Phage tail tube protein, TTP n=1 Tax=Jiella avicenniae TaxID=2907202 RepID=A0A9X1P593_9HYPH|nr:phage tail tube protein [Jiella avicenniae]MCE7029538.1 hypothetical protein [Jiella avicenniae]
MPKGISNAKTKISIGGVYADGADLTAVASWTPIGEIVEIGEIGEEVELITKEVIGDAYVRKAKGTRNPGSFEITVLHKPGDAGQTAMRAAQIAATEYTFKIELEDGEQYLFAGLVMSDKRQFGAANEMVATAYQLEVTTPKTTVAA